jgi:hypothetical protein
MIIVHGALQIVSLTLDGSDLEAFTYWFQNVNRIPVTGMPNKDEDLFLRGQKLAQEIASLHRPLSSSKTV